MVHQQAVPPGAQPPGLVETSPRNAMAGGLSPCRSTSSCLISPIALAGFRPFGQVCVQFMIVWQR